MASKTSGGQIHERRTASSLSSTNLHSFTRAPTPPLFEELNPQELKWRERYAFLLDRGFSLRPRYRPGWKPSWVGSSLTHWDCEDSINHVNPTLLDAKRTKDGWVVCIKMITKKSDEIEIARYLSPTTSKPLEDPKNHSVPVLDFFRDPISPDVNYLVMPLLRPFDDPEFVFVGEVVDFVTQILEGTEYMHRKLVAHCDLTGVNIMMDALPLFPRGWHFASPSFAPDGIKILKPRTRIDHPVRYYIIDYDCAVRFLPGQSPVIRGLGGRDDDPPELELPIPFDHFKLDVFTLGNVFRKDLRQKFIGLEFLDSLIQFMMTHDCNQRPTALVALQYWYKVKASLNVSMARWRLRKPDESVGDRVFHTVADGIVGLKSLFDGDYHILLYRHSTVRHGFPSALWNVDTATNSVQRYPNMHVLRPAKPPTAFHGDETFLLLDSLDGDVDMVWRNCQDR
ncbi:hypothetical protein Hypma_001975 [Hypsizygus marmoreus]|uniref:Protein kinase domain-containing protein n=1 Tax=Hypsizygus marmoreus TaxID=39966 RepID=A0A369J9Y4_HYPMA|nr:hypothetical protein Hypma_001975 [Hypsizygus marmoreus]